MELTYLSILTRLIDNDPIPDRNLVTRESDQTTIGHITQWKGIEADSILWHLNVSSRRRKLWLKADERTGNTAQVSICWRRMEMDKEVEKMMGKVRLIRI